MTSYAERLAQADEAWEATKVKEPGELPPDGTYQALVDRFDFFEARSSGQLFLKTEMTLSVGGEDWPAETIHNIEDPDRFEVAKRHLRRLGVNLERLSEIEARLPEAVGVPVEVAVVTSEKTDSEGKPYRNLYINKRLGPPVKQSAAPKPADDFGGF